MAWPSFWGVWAYFQGLWLFSFRERLGTFAPQNFLLQLVGLGWRKTPVEARGFTGGSLGERMSCPFSNRSLVKDLGVALPELMDWTTLHWEDSLVILFLYFFTVSWLLGRLDWPFLVSQQIGSFEGFLKSFSRERPKALLVLGSF